MKARFLSIVLVVAVLCSFSPSGFGAGKPKAKPNKKEKESIEVPFDVTVERLPPRFWGNNLIRVYQALKENSARYRKNEFETNEAFGARVASIEAQPLVGKLNYKSTIAVSLLTRATAEYNADNEVMSVTIRLGEIFDEELKKGADYDLPPAKGTFSYSSETVDGHSIEVFTSLVKTKKYTGSNAFGVKAKITAKVYQTLALAVRNDYRLMRYGSSITLNIPMPADKAREAKYAGNILLIGELLHPYVGEGSNHSSATIDDPIEVFDMIRYVGMKLSWIWFYNLKTGEIFHREQIVYPDVHIT